MQQSIAFFDFDGTITKKDTMLELARYCAGNLAYTLGMAAIFPWLVSMKLGLTTRTKGKEKFLSHFFGKMPLQQFNDNCFQFMENKMPGLIRKEAMNSIQTHLSNQTTVVVVSASAENWVAPWCTKNNLQFICTRLEVKDNLITGKLLSNNCNGYEKVSRIKQLFNLADYKSIYCYGNTSGDKMMLELATHPFYKTF